MSASILVIGASGRMGKRLIQCASHQNPVPAVHAFLRNPAALDASLSSLCASVRRGDALCVEHVYQALEATRATHVVVAVGVPNSHAPSTLRTDSAKVLTEAIAQCGRRVKVVVISSIGAADSRIKFKLGFGKALSFMLRHVLSDHTAQEQCFNAFFDGDKREDLLIVRPTALQDGRGGRKLMLFDGGKTTPALNVDRRDVAEWVVQQICGGAAHSQFGLAVNVTAAPAAY